MELCVGLVCLFELTGSSSERGEKVCSCDRFIASSLITSLALQTSESSIFTANKQTAFGRKRKCLGGANQNDDDVKPALNLSQLRAN